jgi:S1-C subfamily serine protease
MFRIAAVAAALLPGALALVLCFLPNAKAQAMPPAAVFAAGNSGSCGVIGVSVRKLSTVMAESLGLTERYGAIFGPPQPNSPAAQAGIEAGDVVTAINGKPLAHASDFGEEIAKRAPNTRIYLTVWRSRQMMDVPVVLGSGKCPSVRGNA